MHVQQSSMFGLKMFGEQTICMANITLRRMDRFKGLCSRDDKKGPNKPVKTLKLNWIDLKRFIFNFWG
jgi:hypothetical protein